MDFSHIDNDGRAKMVDVGDKIETDRLARARASIKMKPETLELIKNGGVAKGDVLHTAKIAGIMAAKKTSELIPMCHNIFLSGIDIAFNYFDCGIEILATSRAYAKTGVEMEALTAATVAALTIYDMAKAVDKEMIISDILLLEKSGGKSGKFERRFC
ncbi:MAG: cyclic pyranopterin monophosphate synthase MoaC [Clostridia bacterium]|nr:cyclic pyranopterin monophosphate synthase MoaC [Clostridia bacterium]